MYDHSDLKAKVSYQQTHTLPTEILLLIIELASGPKHAGPFKPLDATSEFPCAAVKPDFETLRGLSHSCRQFYKAVRKQWFRTLYVREVVDWSIAIELDICVYVQEIRAVSASLTKFTPRDIFLGFQNLHTAFIDAHNDFVPNEASDALASRNDDAHTQRGYYHRVVTSLPPSLRRLWIVNVHGPDAAVIHTVRAHCPQLEELSISRCTLFSTRLRDQKHRGFGNECKFWSLFPDGHDSYFAAEGVESYVNSLSRELEPLSKLKKLHMGVYLTPHDAIEHYRQRHVPVEPDPPSMCCTECHLTYGGETTTAETMAKEIIFRNLSNLKELSWASFFTESRMGATLYINSDTPNSAAVGK
ncbi:hypothetical protein BDV93DRAFT_575367 [Ceratobasidium sp. AG-I]|nr:hypothetical protein BDV93DRAFT_575367 [Ceratobasidium sp. AG-I]